MNSQALAVIWAQWRSIANQYRAARGFRIPFSLIAGLVWYGLWTFVAVALARFCADPAELNQLQSFGTRGLLLVFLYWQLTPILTVNSGISLDLKRLLVYPIPSGQLFGFEVLLRITSCVEMCLVTLAAAIGLVLNPLLPFWSALALLPFAGMNLFGSSAVRDLLVRLFARKGIREAMVLVIVILTTLPQFLLHSTATDRFRLGDVDSNILPFGATASLIAGRGSAVAIASVLSWTFLAWVCARWQFQRSLRFEAAEVSASRSATGGRTALLDRAAGLLSSTVKDPLAALIEKEVRVLSRSPRFRLLFLMGFSFGLLIWLPLALRGESIQANYLTFVSGYALMLLGEVAFWNNLGMDRSAVQTYFAMPVDFGTVLLAKNLTAGLFIGLELVMITLVCALLRMPLTANSVIEAFCITVVLALFLCSIGNVLSVRHARPVDPAQSWRTGGVGRVQAYLLLIYPLASAPVLLAYGARYAFESELAFYAVLLLDFSLGVLIYGISMESAVGQAEARKEELILSMSKAENPVA